jgi:hypothetical protein
MKKDIVTLIEGDIVNSKLIYTFLGLGINADDYLSDSSTVIFRMLKIPKEKRTDDLYKRYYKLLRLGDNINLTVNRKELKVLAQEIYLQLKNREA